MAYGRRIRKKRRVVSTTKTLINQHKILNTSQDVTMRFAYRVSLDSSVGGATVSKNFRANGLYDPYHTGIGHQPRGFDQCMALYDHYYVKKATIQVWVRNSSGSTSMLTIRATDEAQNSTDYRDVAESAYGLVKQCHPSEGCYGTLTVDVPEFLGKPLKDDAMMGTSGLNPSEQAYFNVALSPIDGTNTINGDIFVVIIYEAALAEPKQPTIS